MNTPILLLVVATLAVVMAPVLAMAQQNAPQPPPGEAGAREALNASPRHGEYVDIEVPGRETSVRSYVVYPERPDKAPVVIVIHEIFGLTDWVRGVTDQLAADGFIAIAPDLLSGMGPDGGGTEAFADRDSTVAAVRALDPSKVDPALNAVMAYGTSLPAANGNVATVGYCWGGSQSFRYATVQPELDAAVVYYGSAPDAAALEKIQDTPVLGLYGADDARVNATIEPAKQKMQELGKTYEPHIYESAGHGFLRAQEGRDGANRRAAEQAWPTTVEFLRTHTGQAGG